MQSFRLNGMRKSIGVELHKKNMPGTEAIGFFCSKENQTQNDEEFPVVATIRTARNWRGFGLILAAAMAISAPLASAFMAEEVLIADPAQGMPDPEFDQIGNQVTWKDRLGGLFVAPIDSVTGDFRMNQAQQLDTDVAPIPSINDGTGTGTGPEWVYSGNGAEIVYTKEIANSWHLWRARRKSSGGWEAVALPDSNPFGPIGLAPIGSLQPGDGDPKVCYLRSGGPDELRPVAWRRLNDPTAITISLSIFTGRWINHESKAVVFVQPVNEVSQVFLYDVGSNTSTQLTFTPGEKLESAIWRAPEFQNESILMSQELFDSGQVQIGIYRKQSNGQWTKINTLTPPTNLSSLRSPEPSVYNGQSYIVFLAENGRGEPSEVWIAGIRPDAPFYRQVSPPGVILVRNDPEFFSTDIAAFVYYQTRDDSSVYRADTGLGPPTSKTVNGTVESESLNGTAASDRIFGGIGSDILTGGGGRDHFVYEKDNEGWDTIKGFNVNEDVINMILLMAQFGYQGTDPIADGYVVLTKSAKNTVISIDPDGRGNKMGAKPFITIRGIRPLSLKPANFVF